MSERCWRNRTPRLTPAAERQRRAWQRDSNGAVAVTTPLQHAVPQRLRASAAWDPAQGCIGLVAQVPQSSNVFEGDTGLQAACYEHVEVVAGGQTDL